MAKKKSSNHSKIAQTIEAPPQLPHHRLSADSDEAISAATAAAMDESSEKLENLKALNNRLLQETLEGRSKIEALVKEKESLEAELALASSVVGKIEGLEKENRELAEKLVRVCEESDLLKSELVETEERERLVREESEKLKVKCEGLVVEKKEREVLVEELKKVKGSVSRDLAESERAVEEMKGEIERVWKEKIALERELSAKSEVESGLRSELEAMRERVSELERSIREGKGAMNAEIGALRNEKAEKERIIEELVREKSEIESVKVGMESELSSLTRELGEVRDALTDSQRLFNDQEEINRKLVSEIKDYKEALESAERDRDEAFKSFINENRNVEGLKLVVSEKEKMVEEMGNELLVLRNENRSRESEVLRLSCEARELKEALLDSHGLRREQEENIRKLCSEITGYEDGFECVARERDEARKAFEDERKNVEELKWVVSEKEKKVEEISNLLLVLSNENKSRERSLSRLSIEMGELSKALLDSQGLCRDQEESIRKLVSELSGNKDSLGFVTHERDEARKALDEERKNVKELKLVATDKDKQIEEISKKLQILKDEKHSLVEKTKDIESRLNSLVNEQDSTLKKLAEAEKRMEEWRAKVASTGTISERALTMLKKTASMVSAPQPEHGKKEAFKNNEKLGSEIQPYFAELETIHKAFNEKQKIVEDLKQQVEALKRSEDEANRRKSFWTIVSSATTIFAAASVAYVAKTQR